MESCSNLTFMFTRCNNTHMTATPTYWVRPCDGFTTHKTLFASSLNSSRPKTMRNHLKHFISRIFQEHFHFQLLMIQNYFLLCIPLTCVIASRAATTKNSNNSWFNCLSLYASYLLLYIWFFFFSFQIL